MEQPNKSCLVRYAKVNDDWHQFEGNKFASYDTPEQFTITPLNILIKGPVPISLERFTCRVEYFWNPNVTDLIFTCTRTQLEFVYRLIYSENKKQFIIATDGTNAGGWDTDLFNEFVDNFVGFEFIITTDKDLLKEYNVNTVAVTDENDNVYNAACKSIVESTSEYVKKIRSSRNTVPQAIVDWVTNQDYLSKAVKEITIVPTDIKNNEV